MILHSLSIFPPVDTPAVSMVTSSQQQQQQQQQQQGSAAHLFSQTNPNQFIAQTQQPVQQQQLAQQQADGYSQQATAPSAPLPPQHGSETFYNQQPQYPAGQPMQQQQQFHSPYSNPPTPGMPTTMQMPGATPPVTGYSPASSPYPQPPPTSYPQQYGQTGYAGFPKQGPTYTQRAYGVYKTQY